MRAARKGCDKVVVSLFVNPTQFGPGEDLEQYPRQLEDDLRMAAEVGVDVVFAPGAGEMYAPDHRTWVDVEGLDRVLCGASRAGHFRGVATVVAKLFHLVRPDVAFFGRKDYQQSVVIRRMVFDLDFGVEVRVLPTVREPDGVAMSSRNVYLTPANREKATALIQALRAGQEAFAAGETGGGEILAAIRNVLESTEGLAPEYVAVVNPDSLEPARTVDAQSVALVAARLGETRLIDNVVLGVPE
jgi:pantoate--beta-alanine ligase